MGFVKLLAIFILSCTTLLPLLVNAWPGGAPKGACETFQPGHDGVESLDLESDEFYLKLDLKSAAAAGKHKLKLDKGVVNFKVKTNLCTEF